MNDQYKFKLDRTPPYKDFDIKDQSLPKFIDYRGKNQFVYFDIT